MPTVADSSSTELKRAHSFLAVTESSGGWWVVPSSAFPQTYGDGTTCEAPCVHFSMLIAEDGRSGGRGPGTKIPGSSGTTSRKLATRMVAAARFGKVMDRDENRAKSQNSTTLTLLADEDGARPPPWRSRGHANVDRSTRGPPRGTGSGHGSACPDEGPPVPQQLELRRSVCPRTCEVVCVSGKRSKFFRTRVGGQCCQEPGRWIHGAASKSLATSALLRSQ